MQQQQQTRQRGFSTRTDAGSPPPTANSTTTIDPSLQDPAASNIWVSSAAQAAYNSGANQGKPTSTMSRPELEAEITRLRQRVSELEIGYHWSELKVMKLEAEAHRSGSTSGSSGAATSDSSGSGSRSPAGGAGDRPSIPAVMGGVAPSEEFAASWRSRTDARIKRFCALNRAGNALCAWHDSRRERRAYPPRQAPPGYLNCGCTNEEGSWLSLSLLSRPVSCLVLLPVILFQNLPTLPSPSPSPGLLKRDG